MGAMVSFVGVGYGDNGCERPRDFVDGFFIAERKGWACCEDVLLWLEDVDAWRFVEFWR